MNYDRQQIERIKDANPVDTVIGEEIPLRRSGSSLVGQCPFCEGRKPKLTVTPSKKSWKCWRCNEWGDVVKWVMLRQSLTFPAALDSLIKRAGISP